MVVIGLVGLLGSIDAMLWAHKEHRMGDIPVVVDSILVDHPRTRQPSATRRENRSD
jgi:hypothetical protein